jgi:nickel-dependent lactate racemase
VAISACDGTRPQPRHLMIPAVLEELDGMVRLEDVVVLVATGTHRANTETELRAMFGDEVVDSVRIVNHDSRAPETMVWRGTFGRDVPVWLNREWSEADVRITTGFVEPHFFAGFSGGPKLVAPGLAALDTVLVLHDAARIGDPRATWGINHPRQPPPRRRPRDRRGHRGDVRARRGAQHRPGDRPGLRR